jgi:hypothetical protein
LQVLLREQGASRQLHRARQGLQVSSELESCREPRAASVRAACRELHRLLGARLRARREQEASRRLLERRAQAEQPAQQVSPQV